jgi:hypothetical protein
MFSCISSQCSGSKECGTGVFKEGVSVSERKESMQSQISTQTYMLSWIDATRYSIENGKQMSHNSSDNAAPVQISM